MQTEAKKICSFLSLAYGFRIVELVADFVKERDDRYGLLNVRSFVLEESNYSLKVRESQHLIENQAVLLGQLRTVASDSSTILCSISDIAICRLCGFRFNRAIEGRRVTAHTLLELREHLKRRGVHIVINFKVRAAEFMSHTVTVCEACYDVAIAEHQLMDVEREFARAQNIPVKQETLQLDLNKKNEPAGAITKQVMPCASMYQWRVLFFFNNIINNSIS